ncbi:transketolase [Candidatus Peregrinibacteria bacterium]|nr:transketolase [Candidatus Peregrinibacteria bacterium]
MNNLDKLCINTLRCLSIDMVQKANSGHPGLPLGAAPMAYTLWTRHLRHNPKNPHWFNRDRFVLSAGHGSALLYSLLHLTGYDLSLDDLRRFRQWGSRTPGHPEYGHTAGVETTTGPLGQGISTAVGMAMAEKHLAAVFNPPLGKEGLISPLDKGGGRRPGDLGGEFLSYRIYVLASDGDMMEGISSEASSLAGHLRLDNLIVLYDDNRISIEGRTDITFTEDVGKRFEAYGWHVQNIQDGQDIDAIDQAIQTAKKFKGAPHLIKIRTFIGEGSPHKRDTSAAHGSPLGEEEVRLTKQNLGWDPNKFFYIPEESKRVFSQAIVAGKKAEAEWNERLKKFKKTRPDLYKKWEAYTQKQLPKDWSEILPQFKAGEKIATRKASQKTLNALAPHIPFLIGGSADLSESNLTTLEGMGDLQPGHYDGRNLHFGVREHAMMAAVNGMALSQCLIPYGATFLIFTDYCKPALRLAALMGIQSIAVMTHDSIGLGEDGPTHQSVEQLSGLRAIPNLALIRPADAQETAEAWRAALENKTGPTVLALTRQTLPTLDRSIYPSAFQLHKGAYVMKDFGSSPSFLLIATGSEVSLALDAASILSEDGVSVRVVNMPSMELFEKQSQTYRDSVLPPSVQKRVAIEMASPMGWHKYIGSNGLMIGIEGFGASAPAEKLFEEFGFTPEKVVQKIKKWL